MIDVVGSWTAVEAMVSFVFMQHSVNWSWKHEIEARQCISAAFFISNVFQETEEVASVVPGTVIVEEATMIAAMTEVVGTETAWTIAITTEEATTEM